jgi:hypothetical protein
MISARRLATIFRTRGGGDDVTKLASDLTDQDRASLPVDLRDEALLIVSVPSPNDWFGLTMLHLIVRHGGNSRRVPLSQIKSVSSEDFADSKRHGGILGVTLRNGEVVNLNIDAPNPYVALMNVFMYIGGATGPRTGIGLAAPKISR